MDIFLKYFNEDMRQVFFRFLEIFVALGDFLLYLLDFGRRKEVIEEFAGSFSIGAWVLVIIVNLLLMALFVCAVIGIVKLCKKLFRFRISPRKFDELQKQVRQLQKDLIRANYEKDRLLAMKVADLGDGGLPEPEDTAEEAGEGEETTEEFVTNANRNRFDSPCIDPSESRFFRLTSVDNYYKTEYQPPEYNNEITLAEICEQFRNFAAFEEFLFHKA